MMAVGGLAKLLQGPRTPRSLPAGRTKTGTFVTTFSDVLHALLYYFAREERHCSVRDHEAQISSYVKLLKGAASVIALLEHRCLSYHQHRTKCEYEEKVHLLLRYEFFSVPCLVALRPAETSPSHKENNGMSPTTDELLARLQQY
ncbi:hypothetical protein ANCCAN_20210 [Ancylostoma caninum]|uniref:Uncharacterized protein n=1 Tax=Ancylostoma caninum TaxID=29170 RepID=A0A368FP89_ANCCA|nr:hypothetical protein ANCCAN_20210 [Ancylostoma caninum]